MAKPLILYGPKGQPLFLGGNRMIAPASQTPERRLIPLLNDDFHRNLSAFGRTTLLSIGRHIYWASGAVRGAIEDACTYAAGSFMFESRSKDEAFRMQASDLLYLHDRFCDVAGPPNTLRTFRKALARAQWLDGDMGCLYVEGADGTPYLQQIPSHRIASADSVAQGGPYDGARIVDGVIVDGYHRPIAYRVLTGAARDYKTFVDVPASSLRLHFLPLVPGQVRGVPLLGLAGWDVQDLDESKRWELLAQKAGAGRVFQEWNEEGEAPPGADYVVSGANGSSSSGTPSGLWREVIDAGVNTYFKANSGAKLEAVKFDRPSSNQQAFTAQAWREALAGARLSIDFNLDLTKIGGASLRVLIDKINLNNLDLQADLIEPACRSFDFFRLASFIMQGRLPVPDDWWAYEYQPAARLTADKRYDADVSAQEIRIGVKSRSRGTMELGEQLPDVRNAREEEAHDLFTRAERLLVQHPKIPLAEILVRLEAGDNPNPMTSQAMGADAGAGQSAGGAKDTDTP